MNPYFINWKSYFEDTQIKEYNLKETDTIKLFNTNDVNMPGNYQINYENKYIGELTMMYYIWKNNLKSDYICISQYRKDFCEINFDKLKDDYIQIWHYWIDENFNNAHIPIDRLFNDIDHIDPDNFWKNKFIEYLHHQTIYDNTVINKIMNGTDNAQFMGTFVFAMKWEIYCKLCEFIFGFLDYVFPNESWKNKDNLLKLRDEKRKIWEKLPEDQKRKDWIMFDNDRYIVYIIEKILMVCISSMHKVYQNWVTDMYIDKNLITSCNYFWDIAEFYKRNKKVGTRYIYCKVPDEQFDEIYEFFDTNSYAFPNLVIIHENANLEEITEKYKKLIEMNVKEYIDIDDIYSIKYMSIDEIKSHIKQIQ